MQEQTAQQQHAQHLLLDLLLAAAGKTTMSGIACVHCGRAHAATGVASFRALVHLGLQQCSFGMLLGIELSLRQKQQLR
jgi:hypothetical protein